MSSAPVQTQSARMNETPTSTDKPAQSTAAQAGMLEEDDEFEEFEVEDWNDAQEDPLDVNQWEDNWDDDDIEDDFSQQLRAELAKQNQPQPMKM
ncbi:hypothetical protein IWQ61_007338 [Dispira simplex]|nr:hypothetical protein IWQ61_007338 [Dispira simplex]